MAEDAAANAAMIERFYAAFGRRDHAEMGNCYIGDVRFSDPAFGELHGPEVRAMWRMLCERGTDLEISFRDVEAHDDRGSAHWAADYTFSATGRKVHNEIDAGFRFRDGLIAEHDDRFSLWRWSRQALGPTGLLLGWSPIVRSKVNSQARSNLREYMAGGPHAAV
ncbi:MAG TPA: nuclear transport factor 2 family protein [Solirubrobacterales bacterium]|nr:nuclear transport factor 2 family protein [Solirubrobacterales bacterium]